jgi:hypothetical protein
MDEIQMKYENQIYYISEYFTTQSDDKKFLNYNIGLRKKGKDDYLGLILTKTNNGWEEVRFDNTKGYPIKFIQSIGKLISNDEEKKKKQQELIEKGGSEG